MKKKYIVIVLLLSIITTSCTGGIPPERKSPCISLETINSVDMYIKCITRPVGS